MTAQDRTLDRYQELMQINAAGHVLRSAREIGLFAELGSGQKTIEQLTTALSLGREATELLLDCLLAMNVIERYGDDHALAPVMRLLCEHDADLGDADWSQLAGTLQQRSPAAEDRHYLDAIASTQWIHTPAAMQAAEILDIANDVAVQDDTAEPTEQKPPLKILDLGCGSAVWSCAMAYRDSTARVVAVDNPAVLAAAQHTADSIGLGHRFLPISGNPESVELPRNEFDIVLIAQRLHSASNETAQRLLQQAISALAVGGRLVTIDLFRGPAKLRLAETIEALRLHLATQHGRMKTIKEAQEQLEKLGLSDVQFSFLAASRVNLGLMVGRKISVERTHESF